MKVLRALLVTLVFFNSSEILVAKEQSPLWVHLPETISAEWGAFFAEKGQGRESPMPAPDDKDVSLITRDDVLKFREWWHERIKYEELTANSSNKDFSYLAQILNYARDDKQIDLDVGSLLARVRFTEKASTRPPFSTDFIQNDLLDLNNLMDLNNECSFFFLPWLIQEHAPLSLSD